MNLADAAWVGGAGAVGAVGRFALDGAVRARVVGRFPVGTAVVNLSGSLLLGVLTGLVMFHGAPGRLTLVAGTGFCGGYTTFSTATFETVRLAQQGELGGAGLNLAVSVAGTMAAAAVGLVLAWL